MNILIGYISSINQLTLKSTIIIGMSFKLPQEHLPSLSHIKSLNLINFHEDYPCGNTFNCY